ncbi:MAG TPA: Flp pilus assembly protein CpaB [Candidatus Dormibacteraeota bacterium]|nr:Flp pilus assembly protein CpaB [Candidatus Dormibacteraeota bacterium]
MRRTSRLVLLLGIFLAAMTFVVVLFLNPGTGGGGGGQANGPSAAPTQLATVVAVADIPLGTVVTADMLTTKTLAVNVRDANVYGDPSQAIGKTTRTAIVAGAQVHSSDFQNRAVPLTVPAGKRAMTIAVNQLTGVANLVDTGDTVDLVISLRGDAFPVVQVLKDGSITVVAGINPLSVKLPLLLEDVQIIGVVQQPVAPPPAAANGQPAPSAAPAVDLAVQKLLILAVTPAQAEVLLFARTTGTLDVVLRSPLDAGVTVETTGVILKTLVDKYGVLPPEIVQVPIPTPLK